MNELIISISDPRIQAVILPIKIAFIIVGFAFLAFIIWAFFRTTWKNYKFMYDLTEFLSYRAYGYSRITRQWERVKDRLQTPNEAEYKLAIMEADDVLGNLLVRIGFSQPTVAERLKNVTEAIIPNIQEVTKAHAVRNNIVHDPDYHLTLEETRKILTIYEDTFRALDLI